MPATKRLRHVTQWQNCPVEISRLCCSARVRLWHLADKPTAAEFVAYRTNNGQRAALALNKYAANDPKATLGTFPCWIAGALAKRADQEFRAYEMARFGRAAVIRYRSQRLGLPETAARLLFLGC